METLEFLTKLLGVFTALFTVLGTLYGFYKWLRGKKAKTREALAEAPSVVRLAPATRSAGVAVWPWILGGMLVFSWVGFLGFLGIAVVLDEILDPIELRAPMDSEFEEKVAPIAIQRTAPSVNLTGNWTAYPATPVTIIQSGNRVSLRVKGALLTGMIEESADPEFLACVSVSDGVTSARYCLTRDGQLAGTTTYGKFEAPSVLTRR